MLPALGGLLAEGMLHHPFWGGGVRWRRRALALLSACLCVALIFAISLHHSDTSRRLGQTYQKLHQTEQPLVFANVYPFDVPFYTQAKQPIIVFEDWRNEQLSQTDNWRKELFDAGRFAPALGAQVLRQIEELPAYLCVHPVTWVMAPKPHLASNKLLANAKVFGESDGNVLLRFDRSTHLSCK